MTKTQSKYFPNVSFLSSRRHELIAAVAVGVGLALAIFFFQSAMMLGGLLLLIIGLVTLYLGYDYVPLVVFLQLAFSLELQITDTTRLTIPSELLVPLLFVLFAFDTLRKGTISYRQSPLNITVVVMYFVMVSSLCVTLSTVSSVKAIVRDTGYIVAGYYLIPRYITSENRLKHVLIGCLFLHVLLVGYGFITQFIGGLHVYGKVASPFFIEHCIYAGFITISFSFMLAYFLDYKPGNLRTILAFATFFVGIGIIFTFVRASWISVLFLLFFYLFQFRHKKSAVDLITILIIGALIGIVIAVSTKVGEILLQRFDTVFDFNYVANYDRLDRWLAAWNMWLDYPFFGVGWGAYPDVYNYYISFNEAYSSAFRMGAHNIYLELLAETGVVGLIAYLSMIYMFFRQAFILQYSVESRFLQVFIIGLQGAMLTYLIHAFFNNLGPSDKISLTFWFMMGMIPTISALNKASIANRKQSDSLKKSMD